VDATGLQPGTTYHYAFSVGEHRSPVGRTRTAPAPDHDGSVRVAWFSCQKWTHGFFTGHHDLSWMAADPSTDVDLVVSVGDYVYDSAYNNNPRLNHEGDWTHILVEARDDVPVEQAETLEDFRAVYRHYRSDLNLQAMHANYPFVGVYDNHDGNRPGNRKREGATGAFFDHMPIRRFPEDPERIHRRFRWGRQLELWVLDEQSYRDDGDVPREQATLLGAEQRQWLLQGLAASDARWKLVGSQKLLVPFAISGALSIPLSNFDEAPSDRRALAEAAASLDNVVVLSGDAHVFVAAELGADPDEPAVDPVLTEFSAGLTSSNFNERGLQPSAQLWQGIGAANPHIPYAQLDLNGYGIAQLDEQRATVTFRQPLTIVEPWSETRDLAVLEVPAGRAEVLQVAGAPPQEAQ
jgi:alkaline phosphatase D